MNGRGREGVCGSWRRLRGVPESEVEWAGLPVVFTCKQHKHNSKGSTVIDSYSYSFQLLSSFCSRDRVLLVFFQVVHWIHIQSQVQNSPWFHCAIQTSTSLGHKD